MKCPCCGRTVRFVEKSTRSYAINENNEVDWDSGEEVPGFDFGRWVECDWRHCTWGAECAFEDGGRLVIGDEFE